MSIKIGIDKSLLDDMAKYARGTLSRNDRDALVDMLYVLTVRAYLLRQLSNEERKEFEKSFFGEEVVEDFEVIFDSVQSVEAELVEDYADNALSPKERKQFEEDYLTIEKRRESVIQARALLRLVRESTKDSPSP